MKKVWLACSGEYEQWGPFAAFASEELARQQSADVMEFEVWEHPPRKAKRYEWWVRIVNGVARNEFTTAHKAQGIRAWECPEWLDGWGQAVIQADTHHYPKANPPYTWIIVEGFDRSAVRVEVEKRLDELGAVWGPKPKPPPPTPVDPEVPTATLNKDGSLTISMVTGSWQSPDGGLTWKKAE